MKKRVLGTIVVSFVMSAFTAGTAFAAPDTESLQQSRDQAVAAASDVDRQLVDLLVRFDTLKMDMSSQQVKIEEVSANLAGAQETEQKQYQDMKLRIKYIYEQGDTNFLETLLSVKNYADFVNKAGYIQEIHEYDRKKLEEYIKTKEQVVNIKKELESGQAEMEVMSRDFASQQTQMESTLAAMREQIEDFDGQLAKAQAEATAQINQLAKDSAALSASVGGKGNTGSTQQSTNAANLTTNTGTNGSSQPSGGGQAAPSAPQPAQPNPEPSNPVQPTPEPSNPVQPEPEPSNPGSSDDSSLGEQIADTGCGYVGVLDYVYSGTSLVTGADCSGFTQSIFRLYGIIIPRTAEDQWAGWGKTVSYSDALPGDLVCYSGHVGIYIGGGKLVHASNPTDGVKISNINYRQWLGFKRYW